MRTGRHVAVAFATVIAAAGAQAAIHDTVHRTFNVADGGTLTLEADLGDVTITTGGTANSRADADAILRDLDLSFDQQGNDVRVRSKYRDHESHWFHWRTPLQLRHSIRVPSRYNLEVATAGGDLEVGNIVGLVDCRTSGGDVKLGAVGSWLRGAHSSS
jgi:hypothetical protein